MLNLNITTDWVWILGNKVRYIHSEKAKHD